MIQYNNELKLMVFAFIKGTLQTITQFMIRLMGFAILKYPWAQMYNLLIQCNGFDGFCQFESQYV